MKKRCLSKAGFTLIELLAVISVIAILAALAIPAVMKARERAQIAKSGSNIRQIYQAFLMYTGDNNDQCFWRGADIATEGMDWFAHGGRSTGNLSNEQGGLFNKFVPRPLNIYVGENNEIFRHPSDYKPIAALGGKTHYEMYGNDYAFNSMGYPQVWGKGLSGEYYANISSSKGVIVFLEAQLVKGGLNFAGGDKGHIVLSDGRVEYGTLPPSDDSLYSWGM